MLLNNNSIALKRLGRAGRFVVIIGAIVDVAAVYVIFCAVCRLLIAVVVVCCSDKLYSFHLNEIVQ